MRQLARVVGARTWSLTIGLGVLLAATTGAAKGEQTPSEDGLIGIAFSRSELTVRAETSGRVSSISVQLGEHVRNGDAIARLDDEALKLNLRQAVAEVEATLAEAEAARSESLMTWARFSARSQTPDAWSREEVAKARLEFDEAAATRKAAVARASLALAAAAASRLQFEAARIKAPFSGWVAARYVTLGEQVVAGAPMVRLIGDEGLWVRFGVPIDALEAARPPAHVSVALPGVGTPLNGTVRYVSPEVDSASGMLIAEAELSVPGQFTGYVRPGVMVRVRIGEVLVGSDR